MALLVSAPTGPSPLGHYWTSRGETGRPGTNRSPSRGGCWAAHGCVSGFWTGILAAPDTVRRRPV